MEVHINNITQIPSLHIRGLCSGIVNRNILDLLSNKNEVEEIYGLRQIEEGKVYEGMLKAVGFY